MVVSVKVSRTKLSEEPFLANKFWVEVGGTLEAYFTECSGLQITTEVMEYKEGGLNSYTHKLPVRTSFSNITLKRGLTAVSSPKIWDWYMKTVQGKVERKHISIMLFSGLEPGKTIMRWEIKNAYPIKWTGPSLTAKGNEFAIETLELAHDGFTMTKE